MTPVPDGDSGGPPYLLTPVAPATPVAHFSWPASLTLGVLVVGVIGVLQTAPFWALCWGIGAVISAKFGLPDQSARLLALTDSEEPRWAKHQRLAIVLIFLAPLVPLATAWDFSEPTELWLPMALVLGVVLGFSVYSFALRRGDSRPQRWWWVWLPLASLVILFFAVGGPFRARWAYCESRLTAAMTADEPIEIANTGRFCWHDAIERTVDGERRLYLSDGDDGTGFVYSPSGAIEQVAGIELLRNLGNGWYYFEEGSPLRGFWFDG